MGAHWRGLAQALRQLIATPVASLFNVLVIGVALSLPAGLYLALVNLGMLAGTSGEPQLSVFLALDAGPADTALLEQRIARDGRVRAARFVPRADALRDLQRAIGIDDVIGMLGRNPLPDAFVVEARDPSPESLEALRRDVAGWPKVAEAQLDSAWARKLDAALRVGRLAALVAGALLGFAQLAVTFNTIRLQLLTRRDEIEVAKLIGATDAHIHRPFLYFGALQGLLGGLAAWGILAAALYFINGGLAELARLYGAAWQIRHLGPRDSVSLLAFSAWLGWLGAWFSASRHLWRMAPR